MARASFANFRRAFATCLLLVIAATTAVADDLATRDPMVAPREGFVDEKICASCHADQAAAFAKSHHARAMAVANDKTVRADFNNTHLEHNGVVSTFSRRDGRFFVRTEGADGKETEFEIKYTFAYEPLQQYLADLGGGKLQALDVAWNTEKREWFWLGDGNAAKPGSTYHWTGPFYRWNRTCIDCHSTDPRANFQAETRTYRSSYAATSIGCQSCHGGGARHVSLARDSSSARPAQSAMPKVEMGTCLTCHSRRIKLRDGFGPGAALLDYFSPDLMRQDLYFPDGQILDEVFEFGSFMQSKMSRAGVTCIDCHRPHEGAVRVAGNALCTQCHSEAGSDRFKTFDPRGSFDTIVHTRHPVGSAGAQCVNCHMPTRTYMKVDPRRDHSFAIPRPDLSDVYGLPNACISCHDDRPNAWAAAKMDEWYGSSWRTRPTVAHAFAAAANGDQNAVEALRSFLKDREQSAFVRASAVAEMSRVGGPAAADDVKAAARDRDPLVRLGAAEAAANLLPSQRLEAVDILLADETRAVRIAAAEALAGVSSELLGDARRTFNAAAADFKTYATTNADVAETQDRYGLFLASQGAMGEAEHVLLQAIALDPTLAGSHGNLAELYRIIGQNEKSELAYRTAIAVLPDNAGLRYGHALALVRLSNLKDAIQELEAATRLDPDSMQYVTTLAIGLDSAGRTEEAFLLLEHNIPNHMQDHELLGTAIAFGLKLKRYNEVLPYAEQLSRLQPGNSELIELLKDLRSTTGSKARTR